jgi:hypothetical protein
MNLVEAVEHIKTDYPQELISIPERDYRGNVFLPKPNSKYLYRGEKIYPTTKSNYHRLILNEKERNELHKYLLDLSVDLTEHFIGIVRNTDPSYESNLYKVGSFLQHYGFPIMWLDFTDSIEVAAFFASFNNHIGKGRIWIVETEKLTKKGEIIYKLDGTRSRRPSLQKAFALRMYDDKPDLQNPDHFETTQRIFDVLESDIKHFDNKKLLSTKGDVMSERIIDFIKKHSVYNPELKKIIESIRDDLSIKQTWS